MLFMCVYMSRKFILLPLRRRRRHKKTAAYFAVTEQHGWIGGRSILVRRKSGRRIVNGRGLDSLNTLAGIGLCSFVDM